MGGSFPRFLGSSSFPSSGGGGGIGDLNDGTGQRVRLLAAAAAAASGRGGDDPFGRFQNHNGASIGGYNTGGSGSQWDTARQSLHGHDSGSFSSADGDLPARHVSGKDMTCMHAWMD